MRSGHLPDYDIPLGYPRHDIEWCLIRCVREKGFCVLDARNFIEERTIEKACDDCKSQQFSRPSSSIAPGLLGDFGSAQVATLDSNDGGALSEVDALLTKMYDNMRHGGIGITERTQTHLHQTGELKGEDVELDDARAEEWLHIFKSHQLMCLIGLGPGKGTLELEPFLDDDAEPFDIPTGPGVMVILRVDILLHTHRSIWTTYVLSSFFLCPRHHWFSGAAPEDMNPTARALALRKTEKLRKIRELAQDAALDTVPKEFSRDTQREMNRLFLKGESHAVHGLGCNFPSCRGQQETFVGYIHGLDTVMEIPHIKWEVSQYYDPDPECWKLGKTWTKHMSHVEGLDLFDNKFFMISPAESQGMDPTQRQILEVGYETLVDAGLVKKTIMDSDTGFFLGSTMPEYQWAEVGVGGDLAVMANRISFCLGMKGPNLCLDADHASPLICLSVGTHELDKGCSQVLAMGAYFNFVPMFWPSHMQGHILSRKGRCLSFDSECDGSIRCDGIGSVYVKKHVQKVDDEEVSSASAMPVRAVIVGSKFENQGRAAGFTSPHGPGLCSVVTQALSGSKVSPLDVDAVECDAKGRVMDDAVEVASLMKVLRPLREDGNETLPLQAVKTSTGNSWYTSGMQAFLRAIAAGHQSFLPPLLHLRSMNPHCQEEADSRPALFPTEIMEHRARNAISGVMACGWGGTNAYIQVWTESVYGQRRTDEKKRQFNLCYWPGGGGTMDVNLEPVDCYVIIGSWSGWTQFHTMESEGDGKYGFTVTLGDNRWEMFQIMLDGDSTKVLHPKQEKAPKGTAVYGPEEVGLESTWMIDGRASSAGESSAIVMTNTQMDPPDAALPGTRFRVELREVGRWRYVHWEKLKHSSRHFDVFARESARSSIRGTYYVNLGGEIKEMAADPQDDCIHTATVTLERQGQPGGSFQILRNADPCQTFYPPERFAAKADTEVLGPDEGYNSGCWHLSGLVGDVFKITFERRLGASGEEITRKVSWIQLEAKDFRQDAYTRR